jgi:hypothetical protein
VPTFLNENGASSKSPKRVAFAAGSSNEETSKNSLGSGGSFLVGTASTHCLGAGDGGSNEETSASKNAHGSGGSLGQETASTHGLGAGDGGSNEETSASNNALGSGGRNEEGLVDVDLLFDPDCLNGKTSTQTFKSTSHPSLSRSVTPSKANAKRLQKPKKIISAKKREVRLILNK